MVRVMAALLALALSACTAVSAYRTTSSLRGQPFSDALARFGEPDETRVEGNGHVYVWRRHQGATSCELTIQADASGAITSQSLLGDISACERLLSR